MKWGHPLIEGILLKRYKRFLADVEVNGQIITVHVPNTGSMTSCWEPGWKCALSLSNNPSRKMPYTLELIHNGECWIGVNTSNANKLVKEWLLADKIQELRGYERIQSEKKIGEARLDFFLEGHSHLPPCYVEVKNVTLKLNKIAQFPDAVSERGQKHLRELMKIKKAGQRAVMLYVVQREDVGTMIPAHSIDPEYGKLIKDAIESGVEILVYQCHLEKEEIKLGKSLPFTTG